MTPRRSSGFGSLLSSPRSSSLSSRFTMAAVESIVDWDSSVGERRKGEPTRRKVARTSNDHYYLFYYVCVIAFHTSLPFNA